MASQQQHNGTPLGELADLHRRIEVLAAGSNWPEVEALMAERNHVLEGVTGAQRPAALQAAQKSTDRLLALAKSARLELAGELAKLQRGRRATDIYRANR
ncbi:MAG: flagellar protein FliT [Halioglobus sp.]|nr:flagellar protein FliT [Halioglobus sp.]